jgi:hypothetical protein
VAAVKDLLDLLVELFCRVTALSKPAPLLELSEACAMLLRIGLICFW